MPSGTWTTSDLNVSITSGVNDSTILYCIDENNSCTPTTEYTNEVLLSTQGIRYLRFYSINENENSYVEVQSYVSKIDKTNPTVTVEATPTYEDGTATLSFTAENIDDISGRNIL